MQFSYFRIPRQLITHPRFKPLSADAKLLYGLLLDRMGLSIKNKWYDSDRRVYIYYTVDEVCVDLNCGRDKAMKLLAELDTSKGVGLIERIRQGQGNNGGKGRSEMENLPRSGLGAPGEVCFSFLERGGEFESSRLLKTAKTAHFASLVRYFYFTIPNSTNRF